MHALYKCSYNISETGFGLKMWTNSVYSLTMVSITELAYCILLGARMVRKPRFPYEYGNIQIRSLELVASNGHADPKEEIFW